MEIETQKRIKKYTTYAGKLKNQFKEYEGQSEKYYTDILDRFKKNAKNEINWRQKEVDRLNKLKDEHEGKIDRLTNRIRERKLKGLLSEDEDEPSDDDEFGDPNRNIDDEEYERLKRERREVKKKI